MPITAERVAEMRAQQKEAEERASEEEARVRETAAKFQEQARAVNLETFNQFEQEMHLRESLDALAEAEGLKSPQIHELIKGEVAEEVELRLEWQGKPKLSFPESVLVQRSRGFFSISVRWTVDSRMVTVSGEKKENTFLTSLLDSKSGREEFEKSIMRAYVNPRWNEEHYQIMLASKKPAHGPEAGPTGEWD